MQREKFDKLQLTILSSKIFCVPQKINQYAVALYYFQFLVSDFVLALLNFKNWLRNLRFGLKQEKSCVYNLRLRFKPKNIWLRNSQLMMFFNLRQTVSESIFFYYSSSVRTIQQV